MNFRAVLLVSLLAVVALAATSCGADGGSASSSDDNSAGDPVSSESASWLASVGAEGATFAPGDQAGTYSLVLQGLDGQMIMFTDRPERQAATVESSVLIDNWDDVFSDGPPNAVLVDRTSGGDAGSVVVELNDPIADGENVTFTATVLLDDERDPLVQGTSTHDSPPASLGSVSLFIDPLEISELDLCWNGSSTGAGCTEHVRAES